MLLEIKKLTKEYKRGDTSFEAVNSADLSIASGDFISIIGGSGSGICQLFYVPLYGSCGIHSIFKK